LTRACGWNYGNFWANFFDAAKKARISTGADKWSGSGVRHADLVSFSQQEASV